MPYLNKVASLGKLLLCHIFVFFDVLLHLKGKKCHFPTFMKTKKTTLNSFQMLKETLETGDVYH